MNDKIEEQFGKGAGGVIRVEDAQHYTCLDCRRVVPIWRKPPWPQRCAACRQAREFEMKVARYGGRAAWLEHMKRYEGNRQ